jgi:hypothetical protein
MTSIIPQVGMQGTWMVKDPFSVRIGTLYTLKAIRSFITIENDGVNVYETYYANTTPRLTESDFRRDQKNGVYILTLTSDTEGPLHIPSSYITRYPGLDSIPYHHVVVSLSLGALPVTLDLTHLLNTLADAASDTIGVRPEMHVGVVPLTTVVTPLQHETNEAKREAAISNRTTAYARVTELERQNRLLKDRLVIAEKIILDQQTP